MDKIEKELHQLKEQINLEKEFGQEPKGKDWLNNFKNCEKFSENERYFISNIPNRFSREIELKRVMNKHLKLDQNLDIAFWYIREWGGISTFKDSENNQKAVLKTMKDAMAGEYLANLQNVSSLSKVSSVSDVENQVIYDSRVVFALNWLILKTGGRKFFPIPEGQGTNILNFNIRTIINFIFHKEKDLYYAPKIAYQKYCESLKSLNELIYENHKNEPFYLEMLLFHAMRKDGEIIKDMKERIKIEL